MRFGGAGEDTDMRAALGRAALQKQSSERGGLSGTTNEARAFGGASSAEEQVNAQAGGTRAVLKSVPLQKQGSERGQLSDPSSIHIGDASEEHACV